MADYNTILDMIQKLAALQQGQGATGGASSSPNPQASSPGPPLLGAGAGRPDAGLLMGAGVGRPQTPAQAATVPGPQAPSQLDKAMGQAGQYAQIAGLAEGVRNSFAGPQLAPPPMRQPQPVGGLTPSALQQRGGGGGMDEMQLRQLLAMLSGRR
jgi:hypothetical protein